LLSLTQKAVEIAQQKTPYPSVWLSFSRQSPKA